MTSCRTSTVVSFAACEVFAAWTNHVDSKAINSLDTLVTENGRTVVRHHLIDFGRRWGARRLSLASTMKAIITFPTTARPR